MIVKSENNLSTIQVYSLLNHFDTAFDLPLHDEIDCHVYSDKLSRFAQFILAYEGNELIGFIAYYINKENKFSYIPFIAVHPSWQHHGVGHQMLTYLSTKLPVEIEQIRLQVNIDNVNAQAFYNKEGFCTIPDTQNGKIMLRKNITQNINY